jgi:hypothetical protein
MTKNLGGGFTFEEFTKKEPNKKAFTDLECVSPVIEFSKEELESWLEGIKVPLDKVKSKGNIGGKRPRSIEVKEGELCKFHELEIKRLKSQLAKKDEELLSAQRMAFMYHQSLIRIVDDAHGCITEMVNSK